METHKLPRSIEPEWAEDGTLKDLRVRVGERAFFMLGPAGPERELAILEQLPEGHHGLPVLLGSGLGHALHALLAKIEGPVAVLDKELDIIANSKICDQYGPDKVLFITEADSKEALKILTKWQVEHGGKPFISLLNPVYQRLDRAWYTYMHEQLTASSSFNFWEKIATSPRFASSKPRLLLMTSKYFLMGEIVRACKRLDFPTYLLTIEDKELTQADFVERMLTAVATFKPDFVLTLNHLGIDREGVLMELLERLRLPLASWFVDNPHLIIHLYARLASPWATLFSWDADNLPMLKEFGFPHAAYLPLGTDPERFRPRTGASPSPFFPTDLSFVGNSMVYKVGARLKKTPLPAAILRGYKHIATEFMQAEERSVRAFVLNKHPHPAESYRALTTDEERLAYETLLTWEATKQYRASCVQELLPFTPLIVGDSGWNTIFRHAEKTWKLHPEVNYYDELPLVYPFSAINFNCTSKQMKGAVNQRIFDAPAAGGFVLTDWREQMDNLFEQGKEVIAFHEPAEIGELVRYYLKNPKERRLVAEAARRRVLAEHTWDHRLLELARAMREIYGS